MQDPAPSLNPSLSPSRPSSGDETLALSDETLAAPGTAAPEPPPPSTTWGNFRLIARVGFGGFGEVYRAWDPDLEREIALKLLLPDVQPIPESDSNPSSPTSNPDSGSHANSDAQYRAMLREARALASVVHPNIVRVYGIDRHAGRVGFWTDFVRGKTLSVLLGSQGAFGYREAAMIALDITRALAAVHRVGILHRDIKAENVMREEGGRILLMDFGLSTLPSRQTNIAGTPNYMAPELWSGAQATVSTDLYALGVLLYLLVAGEYPVRLGGLSATEAVAALRRRRPLMDLRSDLPESYLRLVGTATDLDPARRYQSAGELANALTECLGTGSPAYGNHNDPGSQTANPNPGQHGTGQSLTSRDPADLSAADLSAASLSAASLSQASGISSQQGISRQDTGTIRPGLRKALYATAASLILLIALGAAASRTDTGRRWLHIATGSASSGVSASTYDQYLKAQDLLLHSYKSSNLVAAAKAFQQVLAADPTFSLAEAGLGRVFFVQYRNSQDSALLDQAKAHTQKALTLDPNNALAYATLARISAMAGQTGLAFEQVNKAISLDPHSADAYGVLAEVDQAAGRNPDALDALQKAADLAPDDWHWPIRLGVMAQQSGDLKKAAEQFQQAIDLSKDNPVAYLDLGVVEIQTDNLTAAKTNIEIALKIEPSGEEYSDLGAVIMSQGHFDEAAELFKKSLALNPGDYNAWGNLAGATLWGSGGREAATRAYPKAIELAEQIRARTPNDASVVASLAEDYASIGKIDHSKQMIRKALALAPNDPGILYQAGESYEIDGERGKAIPLLAEALAKGYNATQFGLSPELTALRADPAFQSALAKAKATTANDPAKPVAKP